MKKAITRIASTTPNPKEKENIAKVLFDLRKECGLNPERITFEEFYDVFGELDGDIDKDEAYNDAILPIG